VDEPLANRVRSGRKQPNELRLGSLVSLPLNSALHAISRAVTLRCERSEPRRARRCKWPSFEGSPARHQDDEPRMNDATSPEPGLDLGCDRSAGGPSYGAWAQIPPPKSLSLATLN